MTSAAQRLAQPTAANLRPFNYQRDLAEVADLIELCFAGRLDEDGHRYVAQMRRAAKNPTMLAWALSPGKPGNLSMGGFVWQDKGKIVGNISCLPIFAMGERGYLIANVAVHPEYQRSGIARTMTNAALDHFRDRGVGWSWLQVDDDNLAAIRLYDSAGFSEVVRRTTWHSSPQASGVAPQDAAGVKITRRPNGDWGLQRDWLIKRYPPSISWHLPLNTSLLQSGWRGALNRLISDKRIRQWSLRMDGRLVAVASVQSSYSQSDKLWLACSEEDEEAAITHLLPFVRRKHLAQRTLALDFPAGRAEEVLFAAGFIKHQTLIWMRRRT